MNTNIRVCKHCKKIFVAKTPKQEFCNNECKYNYYNVHYNCDKCGEEFITKRTMIQRLERIYIAQIVLIMEKEQQTLQIHVLYVKRIYGF